MSDLISRQAAIDEIKEIYEWYDNVTKERIIEHFVRLPSAQPEPKWIPCSERPPEVTGSYLVTVHPNYIMLGSIHVDKLSWFDGRWWFDLDGQDVEFPDPIIAWRPMPEPYKGGNDV